MKLHWTTADILDIHANLAICIDEIDKSYQLKRVATNDMITLTEMRRQCEALKSICAKKIVSGDSLDNESFSRMFLQVPSLVSIIRTSVANLHTSEV